MSFAAIQRLEIPTVLNNKAGKIPQWDENKPLDISDTQKKSSVRGMMGKDIDDQFKNFMNMLMVMIKNQDPTENVNNFQMAQSLMGFVQASGLAENNELMKDMIDLMKESRSNDQLDLLGSYVYHDRKEFTLAEETTFIEYDVTEANKGRDLSLVISDPDDYKVIAEIPMNSSIGRHQVEWDGKTENGDMAEIGKEYRIAIRGQKEFSKEDMDKITKQFVGNPQKAREKIEKELKQIEVACRVQSKIDSVEYDDEMTPYYRMGNTYIREENIERIVKKKPANSPMPYGAYKSVGPKSTATQTTENLAPSQAMRVNEVL